MSASAMDTIKSLLGDDADEKIKAALGSLSAADVGGGNDEETSKPSGSLQSISSALDDGTLDSIMQIKSIIDHLSTSKNDTRSNLLMSLKPYMRGSRQNSIDTAVKMLNLSKLSGIFKMR